MDAFRIVELPSFRRGSGMQSGDLRLKGIRTGQERKRSR